MPTVRWISAVLALVGAMFTVGTADTATGDAGRGGQNEPPQAVALAAYIPGTVHDDGHALPVILEITNRSDTPLRIANQPHTVKVFEGEVPRFNANKPLPPDNRGEPRTVVVVAEVAYSRLEQLRAANDSGRDRRRATTCGVGETILMKVEVQPSGFQPGECTLHLSLRGRDKGRDYEVARSQVVPLTIRSSARIRK